MEDDVVPSSPRSTLRRKRERGSHDRELIHAILDEGLICHVGTVESGSVVVTPTAYARVDEHVYLHGAASNAMLKRISSGSQACLTVTLLDGLVLSRSAFHHSMNYRSVVLFGTGSRVEDPEEKRSAALAIVDHMAPGRSADVREPSDSELKATSVVRFPIDEGSAKVRIGGPIEEPEDLELPYWAGQLPLMLKAMAPVPDDRLPEHLGVPRYLQHYDSSRSRSVVSPTPAEEYSGPGG